MSAWNIHRVETAFAEAAVDPSLWIRALDVVTAEAGAFGTVLLPAIGDALPSIPLTASMAPSADSYFRDGWHLRDERYRAMPAFMKNGVADDFDVMSFDSICRHPYYQEFLAPHGLRWFAGVRVSLGEDLWFLSIQRSIQQGPFSSQEKERLVRLCNSLPSCVAISRMLGATGASSILDAFELSQTAAVLIDRHGKVIRPNQSAEQLLRGDLRIRHGRIITADSAATAALDRALHKLIFGRAQAGLAEVIKLPRKDQWPLLAYPGRIPAIAANPLSDCQAIVILVDPGIRKVRQTAVLRSAFDLTDAEARVAGLLGAGQSLEDVCDRLQIAKETGRNHLKSIFAKTGTHRQSELAVMLNSLLPVKDMASKAGPEE